MKYFSIFLGSTKDEKDGAYEALISEVHGRLGKAKSF